MDSFLLENLSLRLLREPACINVNQIKIIIKKRNKNDKLISLHVIVPNKTSSNSYPYAIKTALPSAWLSTQL